MSRELKDALKKRLDENYTAFIESLQGKTASELIAMAPEITAAQQLHEELPDACSEDDAEFLLRFDNPLEVVCGAWESEITGYDHSGEMGHMLWEIRGQEMRAYEQLKKAPPKPQMKLSEKEHRVILIAGEASNMLHGAGQYQQACELFQRAIDAENYEAALRVIKEYVDVEMIPNDKLKRKSVSKEKSHHER